MRHLTRDFLTLASASCPGTNMYALSIFLAAAGGFTQVGQTNFDLTTGSIRLGHGISASINTVGGPEDVYIPSGTYVVSAADVDRILVLKSQRYPTFNSGLFRILSFDATDNTVTVDYRTSGSPPAEQYLNWAVYENELTAGQTWHSGSNTNEVSGYASSGVSASCSRIILLSPDPSAWTVRLCLESLHDISGAVPSGFSVAPGYNYNGDGDFDVQSVLRRPGYQQNLHLHAAQWYDTTSSLYRGMTVGLTPLLSSSNGGVPWSKGQWRISMIVDDVSGSAAIVNQNVSLSSNGSGWCVFGLSEDESLVPLGGNVNDQTIGVARLFVVGSSNEKSNLTWTSQFHVDNNTQVVGWSEYGYPCPAVLSCYSDILNPGTNEFRYLTSSADTPWMNATELLDAEILLGTVDQTYSAGTTTPVFKLSPRRLGRLPFFRQGRANYSDWTCTSDANSAYYHLEDGIFMLWGGPPPTDAVTGGTAYVDNSGSIENQQGLIEYGAYLPGSDPVVPTLPQNTIDIDSTVFKKTYSFFRQVPVIAGVIKGGSNSPPR